MVTKNYYYLLKYMTHWCFKEIKIGSREEYLKIPYSHYYICLHFLFTEHDRQEARHERQEDGP